MDQGNGRFKMLDAKGLKDAFDSLTSLEEKLEVQKRIFSVGEEVLVISEWHGLPLKNLFLNFCQRMNI